MVLIKKAHMQANALLKANKYDIAAWILVGFILLIILVFHLLPALLAGLLVYELIHILTPYIARKLPGDRAKLLAIAFLVIVVVSLLTLAGAGLLAFFRSESGSLHRVIT